MRTLARLNSLSHPAAGRWLKVIPSDPTLTLSDQVWTTNLRLYLGLPPMSVPVAVWSCSHGSLFDCNGSLQKDEWHWLSCNSLKRGAGLHGHDAVASIMYEAGRELHQVCEWQPTHLIGATGGEQPDLLLHLAKRKILGDVTIVNPLAPTHVHKAAWEHGGVLFDREKAKQEKYAHLAKPNSATVVGLAFDVFGGIGRGATDTLEHLCQMAQESFLIISPMLFANRLFDRIAVALARRVGALIQQGAIKLQRATRRMLISRASTSEEYWWRGVREE